MNVQSNRPVSPLSVMAQQRRYEQYTRDARGAIRDEGIGLSHQSINRVVQESVEAVVRNLGTILTQ